MSSETLPQTEVEAAVRSQEAQVETVIAAFRDAIGKTAMGVFAARALRDLLAVSTDLDLERLPKAAGVRLIELVETIRPLLHRTYGDRIAADEIEIGCDSAILVADMLGTPWTELRAIDDRILFERGARVAILANALENAELSSVLHSFGRPSLDSSAAPAGAILH